MSNLDPSPRRLVLALCCMSVFIAGIDLSSDLLDRIDQIVPAAVTINVADNMWNHGTTALDAASRRR